MSGINTISTTPDPDNFRGKFCFCLLIHSYVHGGTVSSTYHTFSWESDKRTRKRHKQKRLVVSSDSGPSPHTCISKRSDGGNHRVLKTRKGEEHGRVTRGVSFHPIVRGPPEIFFFNFERFSSVFNGF